MKFPILTRRNLTSVRIGKLWVEGKNGEAALARFTKPLFCLNHSTQFPYSLLGSATALRFKDRCFLICCAHQFASRPPDDIVVPTDKYGEILVSGSRMIWANEDGSNTGEEFLDLRAMEFVPSNYQMPNFEARFFPLSESECWRGDTDRLFMVFGYPTGLRTVDYEIPHIDLKQAVTSARYSGASNAAGVHRIEMTRTKRAFSSDGLSGGPVYYLGEDADGYFVGFAGIIMRGSDSEFLHILDAARVLTFLRHAVSERAAN